MVHLSLLAPSPGGLSSSTTVADAASDKQDRRLQRLMEAKQADEDQDSDEEFEDRLQRHRRIMGPEIVHTQVRQSDWFLGQRPRTTRTTGTVPGTIRFLCLFVCLSGPLGWLLGPPSYL